MRSLGERACVPLQIPRRENVLRVSDSGRHVASIDFAAAGSLKQRAGVGRRPITSALKLAAGAVPKTRRRAPQAGRTPRRPDTNEVNTSSTPSRHPPPSPPRSRESWARRPTLHPIPARPKVESALTRGKKQHERTLDHLGKHRLYRVKQIWSIWSIGPSKPALKYPCVPKLSRI